MKEYPVQRVAMRDENGVVRTVKLGGNGGGAGRRTCRFVVGTATAGWTEADCDFLCDGVDDQVKILEAINTVNSMGGGVVLFLDGEYHMSNYILIKNISNVRLTGSGNTIIYSTKRQSNLFWALNCHSFSIENMTIKQCIDETTGGYPTDGESKVVYGSVDEARYVNLRIEGFRNGVYRGTSKYILISECTFIGCKYGIDLNNQGKEGMSVINKCRIIDSELLKEAKEIGIKVSAGSVYVTDCFIDGWNQGIHIAGTVKDANIHGNIIRGKNGILYSIFSSDKSIKRVNITGNIIEVTDYSGISLFSDRAEYDDSGILTCGTISNNTIHITGTGTTAGGMKGISITGKNLTIGNNSIEASSENEFPGVGIELRSAKRCTVQGNVFYAISGIKYREYAIKGTDYTGYKTSDCIISGNIITGEVQSGLAADNEVSLNRTITLN